MVFKTLGLEGLDAVVNVRLLVAEKERLQDDADMAGMSMSALVRARYFGRPIIANADALMIKELRRVAGSLRDIHNTSGGAYSKDTAAALVVLVDYISDLSASRMSAKWVSAK
jgi:hypothetical protein